MARYVRVTSVSYGGAGGPEAVEQFLLRPEAFGRRVLAQLLQILIQLRDEIVEVISREVEVFQLFAQRVGAPLVAQFIVDLGHA